jgi:hypothetical protein
MAESDAVATTTIAVHRGAWSNLSPEVAAMIAPPVTVSAAPLDRPPAVNPWRRAQLARSRANMPVVRHQRPNR